MRDISRVKLSDFSLAADQAANLHALPQIHGECSPTIRGFCVQIESRSGLGRVDGAIWMCYGQKRERGREDALHVQRSRSLPLLVAAYPTAAFSRRSNSGIGYNVNSSTTTIQSIPYTRKSKSQSRNRECAYDLDIGSMSTTFVWKW